VANLIYYLPGWAGHLSTGLGQALMDRGFDVTGRETRGDFKDLSFTDQVETVKEDLLKHLYRRGTGWSLTESAASVEF
jgi:hypothetical protein